MGEWFTCVVTIRFASLTKTDPNDNVASVFDGLLLHKRSLCSRKCLDCFAHPVLENRVRQTVTDQSVLGKPCRSWVRWAALFVFPTFRQRSGKRVRRVRLRVVMVRLSYVQSVTWCTPEWAKF